MRGALHVIAHFCAITAATVLLVACGRGDRALVIPGPSDKPDSASVAQPVVTWPSALPVDALQPWERVDGAGRIVSSINLESQFVPGVEWRDAAGEVAELGEAAGFASGAAGEEAVSYALYRIPLEVAQPGTIAADVNLHSGSTYYLGVADYSANTWRWHGPFNVPHVRVSLPHYEYTSEFGNLFIAVVAYDGASFDLVGLGVNARDEADSTAPSIPEAPILTPVAGGLHVRWLKVDEEDVAGYRVYAGGNEALGYIEGGTDVVIPATGETTVTLTAIDLSGNESEPSEASVDTPLTGTIPAIELIASAASGGRNAVINLTATGAETYDWDVDGDGTFDITGDATGIATASTANLGIIRPALRGHTTGGGFSLSAVSLIIAGNSRPVAAAYAQPPEGNAPLEVNFDGEGVDDDGVIELYAWDFQGDGLYDFEHPADPATIHEFTEPGIYNAKLRVTDNEGAWDVDTVTVQVHAPLNSPPTAALDATPTTGDAPLPVELDAGGSSDPDAPYGDYIARYEWDLEGDGSFDKTTYEPVLLHTYTSPGLMHPTLRVEDSRGGSGYAAVEIDVTAAGNTSPTADITVSPSAGSAPLTCTLDASASSDPDGTIVLYEWDYDGDGAYDASGPGPTTSHIYHTPGEYQATVKITDDDGAQDAMWILVTAHGWRVTTPDSSGSVFESRSMIEVNGQPAIAYCGSPGVSLKYVRALDATGSAWGTPLTLDSSSGDMGRYPSMAIVNGNPAISYPDGNGDYLMYIRANDPDGETWGSPVAICSAYIAYETCLVVADGNPAICFTDQALKYVRANDANGTTWGAPYTVDTDSYAGIYCSMKVISGRPAIAYNDYDDGDLKYIRANDASGSTWPPLPTTVDSAGDVGRHCEMTTGGFDFDPFIAYYDYTNSNLKTVWASNSTGSSWEIPETADSTSGCAFTLSVAGSLTLIDIAYDYYAAGYLRLITWQDSYGLWLEPETVDFAGFTNYGCGPVIVNFTEGTGICYRDGTNGNLKFAFRY